LVQISIVIPALNESAGIASAVVRAWLTRPAEVIVVDGQSDDDTLALARGAGATTLCSPRGRAVQQNFGARQASGDVLLFLHADTWLAADALEQIRGALANRAVIYGAFQQRIDAPGLLYRLLERGNAFRARRGMPYGDQGIFIRRQNFDDLGGFPEVSFMEDWLLMRRLRRLSKPVLLPGPLYVSARRWQKHGVVRQTVRNWSLITAARLGVSPDRLARFYSHHAKP
jgi:rSAM/selenodomain-associated transferase 2